MLNEGMDFEMHPMQGEFEKEMSKDKDLNIFAQGFGTKVDNFSQKALKELE